MIEKFQRKIKEKEEKFMRDIMRLSLQQMYKQACDFADFLGQEAEKWRAQQRKH